MLMQGYKNTMEHSVLVQEYNGANMVHVQNKLYKW